MATLIVIVSLWLVFAGFSVWMVTTRSPLLAGVAVALASILLIQATTSSVRMLRAALNSAPRE